MIKKIFLGVFMMLVCSLANANIYINADVAKQAILNHIAPAYQVSALQEYNTQLKASGDSTMSVSGLYKVCTAAGWDITQPDGKNKCNNFVQALLEGGTYTYYEVCGNDKGKSGGTEYCIEDVFYALVNGIDVQIGQAIALSKEYALVKYNDDIECYSESRKGTMNPLNDYIKCTSKLSKTYYEFKFDDVNQGTETEIHKDTLRAVGNIHNVEFRDSGCSLERINNDSGCALGYNTVDTAVCERLSKSLGRFGMKSTVRNVSYSLNNTETFCAVKFVTNTCTAAADYGLDDTVFQDVQYPFSPTLENYIKDYIVQQLSVRGINVSSFRCDKAPRHNSKTINGNMLSSDILTCYLNDKCINFVFEDLSESAQYSKNAGLSRLACLKHNGQSDGSNCRGLDEAQCATLGEKIKSSGYSMGTHYDRVRGGCVLNGVVTENAVNLVGEIAAGVALTLVTDGAALVPVVVSVGTDLAFAAVQDWQRKIPYSDYQDFLAHVMACSEDTTGILSDAVRISGIKSVENKYCLSETIRQDYQLVVGQMSLLAPEDQKILSDVFKNIVANIGDSEYIRAASESEISLLKQGRNLASGALLAGLFFIQPEKVISKFDNVAHNIARLRFGASRNFTKYLDEFKRSGRNVGLPIERLSMSDWYALNNSLIDDGVELFQDGQYMRFRKLVKVVDINDLLRKFNKTADFRPAASNSLGRDYYRIVINDTDDVNNIIKTLQNNGFYVSANQTISGEKFIGVSKENIFQQWADAPTNWLKGYSGGDIRGRGIFDKVYNNMPEDVLRRKLNYIYSVKRNGGTDHDIIEAMKAVGAFNETQAGYLAEDIANETINRIKENADLVQMGKNWRILSENDKKQFVIEVHDIITRERRARVGNTVISFDNSDPDNLGWHRGPIAGMSREFSYNIENYSNASDALETIIHENIHSFQSVYKSSIPDPFVRLSEQHYVQPDQNFNDYQNVLIEVEARYVADHSVPKVIRTLGWW